MEMCRINISKLKKFKLVDDSNFQLVSFKIDGYEYNLKFRTVVIKVDGKNYKQYKNKYGRFI